jgi:hypothetical protein
VPFKHLPKKGQKFKWNDDLQAVFEAAQCHLTSTKTYGIQCVLKQEINGIWRDQDFLLKVKDNTMVQLEHYQ